MVSGSAFAGKFRRDKPWSVAHWQLLGERNGLKDKACFRASG